MDPDDRRTVEKDGRRWRIGTAADVAWLGVPPRSGTSPRVAIGPAFAAYATCMEPPGVPVEEHEQALIRELVAWTPAQPWWLGFLDTGAHDVVFPTARRVRLYWDWPYVLVEAGPEQALTWRTGHMRAAAGVLPDLFFPADHTWLVSALWDDEWTTLGGPTSLIATLAANPLVGAREARS